MSCVALWLLATPALAGISASEVTPLDTTYARAAVSSFRAEEPYADALPRNCEIGLLEGALTGIDTAVEATIYLSRDAAGEQPLTQEFTVPLLTEGVTADSGGFAVKLAVAYSWGSESRGTVYVNAKLDAGEASAVWRLSWR